jgi:hypothetical protein
MYIIGHPYECLYVYTILRIKRSFYMYMLVPCVCMYVRIQ